MRLQIELIPRTAWYNNLRSQFTTEQWNVIRRLTYKRANYCCEICGGKGDKHPVEAHEEWDYENGVMKLRKVTALCPACHKVKHIGLAHLQGHYDDTLIHFMEVNNISRKEAQKAIQDAFELFEQRSKQLWGLDIKEIKLWVEKQVATPEDVKQALQEGNQIQLSIQENIQAFAEAKQFSNEHKTLLNDVFNRLIHSYPMLKSLEYNAFARLDHLKNLSKIVEVMLLDIDETNQKLFGLFKEMVGKKVNPIAYSKWVNLMAKELDKK